MKLQRAFFLSLAAVFLVSFAASVSDLNGASNKAAVAESSSQSVTRLLLINADTNQVVRELTEGSSINPTAIGTMNFNVLAETSPSTVGSVKFALDAKVPTIDNSVAYSMAGDNGRGDYYAMKFDDGSHTLTVTPYSTSSGRGTAGQAKIVHFTVGSTLSDLETTVTTFPSSQTDAPSLQGQVVSATDTSNSHPASSLVITSFTLVDADTNQDIRQITDNETIDVSTLTTTHLTIRANTPGVPPGSVRYTVNGNTDYITKNHWPFTINQSGSLDDYLPWNYTLDTDYFIIATPFSLSRGRGDVGTSLAVRVKFVSTNSNPSPSNFVGGSHSVITTNSVTLTAPAEGMTVAPGQTLPMTCDITVAADTYVSSILYSYWSTSTGAGTFYNLTGQNGAGTYTQNVTIPSAAQAGAMQMQCVAYFNNDIAHVYETIDSKYNVTVGSSTNTTTSAAITAPQASATYVPKNTPFTFSVSGTPTDGQIASVKFSASSDGSPAPILPATIDFITDSQTPFTTQATIPRGGKYFLKAKVTLTNNQVINLTKPVFVTDYAIVPNSGEPRFEITSFPGNGACNLCLTAVEDTPQTITYQAFTPNGITFRGVDMYQYGGLTSWGGTGLTYLGSIPAGSTTGSFTFTIDEPGTGVGQNGVSNILIPIAFFSNDITRETFPLRITSNPNENLPTISGVNIINGSGSTISALTSGMQVNIGNQGSGIGQNITIKANPGSVVPASVKFNLTGPGAPYQKIENTQPFSLYGDSGSTYTIWPSITLGAYNLLVTPYTGADATGSAGTPINIPFTVINGDDLTAPNTPATLNVTYRSATETRLLWSASTSSDTASYKVYRNPGSIVTIGNQLTYNDTTTNATGTYTYNVSAVDAIGNESGVSTSVTTPVLSTTFAIGNSVTTTATAAVKSLPESSTTLGNQALGAIGSVVGGPVWVSGVTYWNVNFNSGVDGWTSQTNLTITATPPPAGVPTLYETQRSILPNNVAVVCNSQSSQSCAAADYYIAQRGIRPQNKVTLSIPSNLITATGTISPTTFSTGFGGTNMRDYVLNQIQAAYTSAGLGTADIQAALLTWKLPFAISTIPVGEQGNYLDCYGEINHCATLTSAFSKGAYDEADSNSNSSGSPMPANPYFQTGPSSSLTPRQSFGGTVLTFQLPFDAGNYTQAQAMINRGVSADNTYPTGTVHMFKTQDSARSNSVRTGDYATLPTLFNQTNLTTTYHQATGAQGNGPGNCYASYPYFNSDPNNPGSPWWSSTNYITGATGILGYFTGLSCPTHITSLTYLPGALAVHMTSNGGRLANQATSDQSTSTPEGQMGVQEWLKAGVTAAGGTSKEPWYGGTTVDQVEQKFPKTSLLWADYYTGASAIQSMWSSTAKMGDTSLVGEPLANPWKTSQATFSGTTLTINTTHIKPGETWKLQESTTGSSWTDVSGFTSITAPSGKYGLKTITYPLATTAKCYRLINPLVTQTVKIPVTAGTTWTPSNGVTNTDSCVSSGQAPTDTAAPGAPAGHSVSGTPTQTSISLDWSDSAGNPIGESVFYRVYRSATQSGTYAQVASNLTTSNYTDSGLTAGTTYWYKVASYDAVGNISAQTPSTGISGTTAAAADTTPPNAPAGTISVGGATSSSLAVSWTASTSTDVTGYKIYRSTSSTGTYTQVGTSSTTAYTDSGLSSSTTYYYKVSAYDAANNESGQTGPGSATTSAVSTGQLQGINGAVGPSLTDEETPSANAAGDYFISCNGLDTNNGTSINTPWKTINKLNSSASLVPGKRVLFKRGCTYPGTINAYTSGTSSNPIQYMAYGTGTAPIISGADPVTSVWALDNGSSNVWKTTIATGLTPKYLFIGSSIQTLAREPNTGWNFTDATNGSSITDSWIGQQSAGTLTGATLIMRSSPWSYAAKTISSQSGSVINFPAIVQAGNMGTSWEDTGWGYFVQGKRSFLNNPGEWSYDSTTGALYLRAPGDQNPNSLVVSLSSKDTGLAIGWGRTDVKIKNLVFEGFNGKALFGGAGDGNMKRVIAENLEIRNSDTSLKVYTDAGGATADAVIVRNNYIHDIYNNGMLVQGGNGHLVEGNIIQDIGIDPSKGADAGEWNLFGITVPGSTSNTIIKRNKVINVGYMGIVAAGSGTITENYVENADAILNDGGGIGVDHANGFMINKNIIKHVSYDISTMPPLYQGYHNIGMGFYFGNVDIKNTTVDANVIMDTASRGIFMDHSESFAGNVITNNIIYDFGEVGLAAGDWSNYTAGSCANYGCFIAGYNDVVAYNKVYGIDANQIPLYQLFYYNNASNQHTDFGNYHDNYYYNPFRSTKVQEDIPYTFAINNYTLSQWQAMADSNNDDVGTTASNYTLTDTNLAADIYYNATLTPTTVNVGTGGCTATGGPMSATQTIPAFGAVVVEHRTTSC